MDRHEKTTIRAENCYSENRKWFALGATPDFTDTEMDEISVLTRDLITATGAVQKNFHARAATLAAESFGHKVFVRAVVEVSNFCRENCSYCGMRRENRSLHRRRAEYEQLAEIIIHHRPASVTDINIQAGEDPIAVREVVLPLIKTLRQETNLGISVCLGTLTPSIYAQLQAAGASIYILKFEIANPAQYQRMHSPGTQTERLNHIRLLAESGWRVSSGFIAGLPGQQPQDLLSNFSLAQSLPLAGCSVSPFIPGDETPLAHAPMADINLTLNAMAALRLMRPHWVIPAVSALNLAQPGDGYRRGLRTGANLVTINLTPSDMRGDYVLYKRDRFIMTEERILAAIAAEGLAPSKLSLADFYRSKSPTHCNPPRKQMEPAAA
jgi:biotin synthase